MGEGEAMNRDDIKSFFSERDRLARHLGIELLHVAEGRALAEMEVKPEHLNGVDLVHGGAIFTLADFAFAAASNAHGTIAVALNVSISFVKAASGGCLRAEAIETSLNPRIGTYEITVRDDAGDTVALFHGMAYRKRDALPMTQK